MPCAATQDRQVMVERSDRMWSTGEGNGKPLQYSCLDIPMNSMKRQNDSILKEELPRSVGAQYAAGDQWRNIRFGFPLPRHFSSYVNFPGLSCVFQVLYV